MTGSNDQTIKIFSLSEKKFLSNYLGHSNWVKSVRFSPDVRLIVSGSDDRTVKIWDVTKHCVVTTYLDHLQPINAVRWSPDGTCVASCSNDKKIKIFDIRSGRIIQHYDAHSAPVLSLGYHPSGNYLVSSSLDSTIKIWDVINAQILYTVHGHEGAVNAVSFSRDGDFICSGGGDSILRVWKNNLIGVGYEKSKISNEGLSKPVIIPKKRTKSKPTLKCCNKKNNKNASNTMKKSTTMTVGDMKTNYAVNNSKSIMNSQLKNSSQNMNNNNLKSMSNTKENIMALLPPEMSITFEKLISQLDLVAKTMKIMDQRVQSLESQISTLYNRQRKGFIQKRPPEFGNYEYLLANSGNLNFNNSNNNDFSDHNNINNNIENYNHTEENFDNHENFKESMNYYDEKYNNVKNVFQDNLERSKEIKIDKSEDSHPIVTSSQEVQNNNNLINEKIPENNVIEGEVQDVDQMQNENDNEEHYDYNYQEEEGEEEQPQQEEEQKQEEVKDGEKIENEENGELNQGGSDNINVPFGNPSLNPDVNNNGGQE